MNWKFWKKIPTKINWPQPLKIQLHEERVQLIAYTIDISLQDGTAYTFELADEAKDWNNEICTAPKIVECPVELELSKEELAEWKDRYLVTVTNTYIDYQQDLANKYLKFELNKSYLFSLDKKEISINPTLIKEIKVTRHNSDVVYAKHYTVVNE